MSNRSMGNHFEGELCQILSNHGWWTHNVAQNQAGQPADIIAVKNNEAVIIDCKVCSNDKFVLSRVETNQEAAMTLWEMCGNYHSYFALKLSDGTLYMVSSYYIFNADLNGIKSIDPKFDVSCKPLDDWLEYMEGLL